MDSDDTQSDVLLHTFDKSRRAREEFENFYREAERFSVRANYERAVDCQRVEFEARKRRAQLHLVR